MRPPLSLLFVATLVLLNHLDRLGLAKSLPTATPGPETVQRLYRSQKLLKAVSNMLQKASQILGFHSCTSEEIDHEDITKDKTSTVEACLPLKLTMNQSCLASREVSVKTLCLRSIYEDLKMYQGEFKAINAKLLMDPMRQIILDQNMMEAIDELMQVLNFNSETVPPNPSLEENFYKTKKQLCILLYAFRIRAVTIERMMSYLISS